MRVLVLRPKELIDETVKRLNAEGFEAYGCPFIELEYFDFEVPEHEYAIVTSQNVARVIREKGIKLKKVIAIGKKTAEALGIDGILLPTSFDSKGIVDEFSEILRGKKVVAFRSDKGSDELRKLAEVCDYKEVIVYRTKKLHGKEQRAFTRMVESCFIDVVVFSSRSIAESFIDLCDFEALKRKKVIALGPPTAEFLIKIGLKPLIPAEYTFDGVVELLKSLKGADSLH